jgi:hypothetical protein
MENLKTRWLQVIEKWSGRRESNPQPTAWKAVTLPLSYSRWLKDANGRARRLYPF